VVLAGGCNSIRSVAVIVSVVVAIVTQLTDT
jgi:hypothetical protein